MTLLARAKKQEYSDGHSNIKLLSQCCPLVQKLGVELFIYRKLSEKEPDLYFSSNERFDSLPLDSLLPKSQSFWKELKTSTQPKRYYYYMWNHETHLNDDYYKFLHQNGIWHGVNIYRRSAGTVEVFTFARKKNQPVDPNFYLNNLESFLHFLSYFQAKIAGSNYYTSRHKYAFGDTFGKLFINYDDSSCLPMNQNSTENQRIVLTTTLGDVTLSKREGECLRLLSLGKTAKEIGRVIGLSHRTIESYIGNIRQKTGLHTRSDLVEAYQRAMPFTAQLS